ncbi:MAG: HNH endonuclease signature motif containing protein [Pseudomonadota bacterium]
MKRARPGRWALRDRRWPALRLKALRRDGFRCVQCGARGRLEVHHREPVRDRPDLAFTLENLASLCASCHAVETAREQGRVVSPERRAWAAAVRELANTKRTQ